MHTTSTTSTHPDTDSPQHEAIRQGPASSRSNTRRRGGSEGKPDQSFETIMEDTTRTMPRSKRIFSKLIHNKVVAVASDIIGSTIARPNAILSGAFCSFALTLGLYLVTRNLGYTLSGFESIAAFIAGWLLGLTYDFLKLMITGKR